MKKAGVAILGLGVVGGGTYQILTEKREFFKKTQGVPKKENFLRRLKVLTLPLSVFLKRTWKEQNNWVYKNLK